MASGRRPLSTAIVLGILGSAGGVVNLITFAIAFTLYSPISNMEEQLILVGLGGSSLMGLVGAIVSIRYPRRGGAVMFWSACTGLLTLGLLLSPLALYWLDFGWWAVVLLFAGIFGLMTKPALQDRSGASVGNSGAFQTP